MPVKRKLAQDDLDPNFGRTGKKNKKNRLKKWVWIFVAALLLFVVATIVIVIVAIEQTSETYPEVIDVVLYIRPNDPLRMSRYIAQAKSVQLYMDWVRNIYVLSPNDAISTSLLGVTFVRFSGTLAEAFEFMPNIEGIAEDAVFLSDQTFPFRSVKKSFLFSGNQPRMFNIFREQSEVNFFSDYLEPTMPTLVTDLVKLREDPQTWQDLVFRVVTEERVTLRSDINRDIFIVSNMTSNAQKQFDKLTKHRPLFATFHIGPANPDNDVSNNLLNAFLTSEFVNT